MPPPQITASPTLSSVQQLAAVTHIAPERFITSKVHAKALNQINIEKRLKNELRSLRSRGPSLLRIGATLALANKLNIEYGLSDVAALTAYDTIVNDARVDEDELNQLTQISTTDETILTYKNYNFSTQKPAAFQYRIAVVVEDSCNIDCGKAQLLSVFSKMVNSYVDDGVIPFLKAKYNEVYNIARTKHKDNLPEFYYDEELQRFISNLIVNYTFTTPFGKPYTSSKFATVSFAGIATTYWQDKKVYYTGIDPDGYVGILDVYRGADDIKDIPLRIKQLSEQLPSNVYLYMPLEQQSAFVIKDDEITSYSSFCVGGGFYNRAEYHKVFDLDCATDDYTPSFQHHIK